jgi:hypothetical protein
MCRLRSRELGWLTLVLLISAGDRCAAQEDRNAATLRDMRAFDSVILTKMTLRSRVMLPRFQDVPESERLIRLSTITVQGDVWASRDDMDPSVGPPKYRAPGEALMDYDRKTRELFVWRDIRRSALYESDFEGVHRTKMLFKVKPDGEAIKLKSPPVLSLERPSHALELPEFYAVVLPAGRGYGRLIDQITECTEAEKGRLALRGDGRWVDGTPCRWDLVVEPALSYMVRHAQAVRRDNSQVIAELKNEGVKWFARGPLPERASFFFDPLHSKKIPDGSRDIAFMDLEDKADDELIKHNRELLRGKYEDGMDVLDHRTGSTARTIVGEVQRTPIPEDERILDDPILRPRWSFDWFLFVLIAVPSLVVLIVVAGALWRRHHRGSTAI